MSVESPDKKGDVVFRGQFFEVERIAEMDGKTIEIARRAPGVRVIIPNREERKILLTREFRRELGGWDHRLPGGKVFESLEEYESFRQGGQDILGPASAQAKVEAQEEAGIDIAEAEHVATSVCGASVQWDLYVFEATQWQPHADGQNPEQGEQIETDHWFEYQEVEHMIMTGEMHEERVALILLQWLARQNGA